MDPLRGHPFDLDLLEDSFPAPVGVAVRTAGDRDVPPLLAEERALLSPGAVEKRRLHFRLGRAAARDALARLGLPPAPIGRGPKGEPLWPPGAVGSISHSGDVAVAVAGRRAHYRGLGVDVETIEPKLADSAALIGSPAEQEWARSDSAGSEELAHLRRTLLFSAKESVFKALYPVDRVWLDFLDAELEWCDARASFRARLLRDAGRDFPAGSSLAVRCQVAGTRVITWTWV